MPENYNKHSRFIRTLHDYDLNIQHFLNKGFYCHDRFFDITTEMWHRGFFRKDWGKPIYVSFEFDSEYLEEFNLYNDFYPRKHEIAFN